jgi:hypothetical protein
MITQGYVSLSLIALGTVMAVLISRHRRLGLVDDTEAMRYWGRLRESEGRRGSEMRPGIVRATSHVVASCGTTDTTTPASEELVDADSERSFALGAYVAQLRSARRYLSAHATSQRDVGSAYAGRHRLVREVQLAA